MRFPLSLLLAACLCTGVAASAQQSAPPYDAQSILSQLKDLKAKQTQILSKEKGQVLAAINAATADPLKAYDQATEAVDFQGQGGAAGSKLFDWRKKNADLLRDRNFAIGLRLELLYIALTWQHATGVKTKDLIPALYEYTNQVVTNYDTLWGYDVLKKDLNESIFVRYFQIGPYIASLQDWAMQPLDVDGIFQKSILPELRAEKDPRVLAYWDERMQHEASRASTGNALAANKFNQIKKPALLWERSQDELLLGDVAHAVADMLSLIKTYPDHPDYDKWTARLTEVVTPPKATPPPTAALSAVPGIPATPAPSAPLAPTPVPGIPSDASGVKY